MQSAFTAAVYHALMTGMLAHYPDTADVREFRQTRREIATETNLRRRFKKNSVLQKKNIGR